MKRLLALGARLEGVDAQTDVYYQCHSGRLKLRRGIIENSLISYHRPDERGCPPVQGGAGRAAARPGDRPCP